MRKICKILVGVYLFTFFSGCLSIGSGPLTNSISLPSENINIKHKLPKGYCQDRSANSSTSLQQTLVITNCIEVKNRDILYYSRRPVDTIIDITFTNSRIPKNISPHKYLKLLAKKMDFKKFLTASSKKKLVYGEINSFNKFFYVSFQRIEPSKRREYVRKYFFLADNKLVIMTILSFRKPSKSTYNPFESFIKRLLI